MIDLNGDDDDTPPVLPLKIQLDSIPSSPSPLLSLHSDLSLQPDPDPDPAPDDIRQILDNFDNLPAETDVLEKETILIFLKIYKIYFKKQIKFKNSRIQNKK